MRAFLLSAIIIPLAFALDGVSAVSLAATSPSGPVDANIFVNLSKKIVPSVVNISTLSSVKGSAPGNDYGSPEDLFRQFFEDFFHRHGQNGGGDDDQGGDDEEEAPPPRAPDHGGKKGKRRPQSMSLGSGFIIDASGLILSNNHVVQDADEIKIYFTEELDEKPIDGEVVGRDVELDVALIKVKTKRKLEPVSFGDSDSLEVGEYVIAVGNPFGQGHSVTHGIISAKGRLAPDFPLAGYLQTDAPINPGNSGGPLVNLKGEVIGINNAIEQRAQGIGFAIPINVVKKVLPQLRTKGTVSRGYIGVLVNDLTPEIAAKVGVPAETRAPLATHVYPGEPADKAGMKPYDVILEVGGKAVHNTQELVGAVTAVKVGDSVPVKVLRAGKEHTLEVKVAQRAAQPGQPSGEKQKGKKDKKPKKHVDIGAGLEDITPEIARDLGLPDKTQGVVVDSAAYGGPADRAGLMRGDIILEVDRKPVADTDAFYSIVRDSKKSYLLRVRRSNPQGQEVFSVIVLDLKE